MITYRDCNFGNLGATRSSGGGIAERTLLEEFRESNPTLCVGDTEATQKVIQLVHKEEIDVRVGAAGSFGSPKGPVSGT